MGKRPLWQIIAFTDVTTRPDYESVANFRVDQISRPMNNSKTKTEVQMDKRGPRLVPLVALTSKNLNVLLTLATSNNALN